MAKLRDNETGRTVTLEAQHLVGRAPSCALRFEPRHVSAQHAVFRWVGERWEVRDLSSRNGTYVNGVQLEPGRSCVLRRGSRISFGRLEESCELIDDSAPEVMAVPLDGGRPHVMDGELLVLPSSEEPLVTIYRDVAGCWILEQPDESTRVVGNHHIFECAGRWWRFSCVDEIRPTPLMSTTLSVANIGLVFAVSKDEEHVELRFTYQGRAVAMGARSRHYLLLTLARRRLDDAKNGVPESACGWLCADDYPHDPTMSQHQLNLDVFRIRKQFAEAGVVDAAKIIERRPLTRLLRIGVASIEVVPL
jgi:hypothetical protein